MRARIPTPEPSAAEVQAAEKTNEKNNRAYLNYAHRLLLLSCRAQGFGCERLDRVMRPVVDRWMQLMRIYLTMDRDAVKAEQTAVRDEFNAMGMFPEEFAL